MKFRGFKIVAVLMLVSMLFAPMSGLPAQANAGNAASQPIKHTLAVSETGIYIVRLQDASLAAYKGGVAGLRATSPEVTGARKLDPSSAASKTYLDYLAGKQGELLGNMANAFDHPVEAVFQYMHVLNAVAVRIDYAEALKAFDLPGVLTVYPDQIRQAETDVGPILIGAPSIWNGDTLYGDSSDGEGIVIGVLDTGINHAHPSFADVDKFGYDHTNPWGYYVGVCVSDPTFCTDKLIGAYDFTEETDGPEDYNGHGSHTASTAGGNFVDVTFDDGAGGTFSVEIRGVAPHANIVAYQVLDNSGSGPIPVIVAGIDQAVADMVDVINYSISGSDDPWVDPVDQAFLDAFTAGIFVSASAGNAGPDPSTVAKTGPWNASVAGTTHSRIIAHPLDVVTAEVSMLGIGAVEGSGPALTETLTDSIVWAGDVDLANLDGCDPWAAGAFDGVIGMVQRGNCTFAIKVDNLTAAGAIGALVYNNVDGPPMTMGGLETTTIPAMFISLNDGLAVADMIDGYTPASATMYVNQAPIYNDDWADMMYASSSRGPSQWELMKPDYGAPAVNILAAVAAYEDDPVQYAFYQGTSMAAPHGSGSAALLIDIHPDWSPAEVKSALATTAYQGVVDTDGTPADPFDIGSGRIDLNQAAWAGFVMDETSANYIAADPYLGGEPSTLNQPSMVSYACVGTCTWTRTIKSTMDIAQDWEISFTTDAGLELSATPMTFTLEADGTQTIEITADVSAAVPDVYYFGNVTLTPVGNEDISIAHLPVVVKMGISNLPSQLDILTDQLTGTVTISDLQSTLEIERLWIKIGGLALGDAHDLLLDQDPTNGDPFDDLSQVFWTTIEVPDDTLRLVAEIVTSEADDVDLFVGSGDTPSLDTLVCVSASGIWNEYCNIDFPAEGTYWVLVQNWYGSADQPDAIRAVTAVVVDDMDNLTVTGPETVPVLEPFELDVNWDEPSMVAGDFWYAQFSVGTAPRYAGNLGYTNVDLEFYEPFYDITLAPATDAKQDAPGAVVSYMLTLSNLGNVEDTITVAASGNLWDVNLPVTSFDVPAGGTADVTVEVTIPLAALDGEFDVVTITATSEGGVEASSELTTTVVVPPEPFITYLPLMLRMFAFTVLP